MSNPQVLYLDVGNDSKELLNSQKSIMQVSPIIKNQVQPTLDGLTNLYEPTNEPSIISELPTEHQTVNASLVENKTNWHEQCQHFTHNLHAFLYTIFQKMHTQQVEILNNEYQPAFLKNVPRFKPFLLNNQVQKVQVQDLWTLIEQQKTLIQKFFQHSKSLEQLGVVPLMPSHQSVIKYNYTLALNLLKKIWHFQILKLQSLKQYHETEHQLFMKLTSFIYLNQQQLLIKWQNQLQVLKQKIQTIKTRQQDVFNKPNWYLKIMKFYEEYRIFLTTFSNLLPEHISSSLSSRLEIYQNLAFKSPLEFLNSIQTDLLDMATHAQNSPWSQKVEGWITKTQNLQEDPDIKKLNSIKTVQKSFQFYFQAQIEKDLEKLWEGARNTLFLLVGDMQMNILKKVVANKQTWIQQQTLYAGHLQYLQIQWEKVQENLISLGQQSVVLILAEQHAAQEKLVWMLNDYWATKSQFFLATLNNLITS